jgi:hypothetical protein
VLEVIQLVVSVTEGSSQMCIKLVKERGRVDVVLECKDTLWDMNIIFKTFDGHCVCIG